MIFDGEDAFPDSVVHYVKFKHFELRLLFAYLREREMILQKDIERFRGTLKGDYVKQELSVIESLVIWMAHNFRGVPKRAKHTEKNN